MSTELESQVRDVVARASFPFERGGAHPAGDPAVEARLERWARVLSADGLRDALQRQLEFEGLTLEDAKGMLSARESHDGALPAWAVTLEAALARSADQDGPFDPEKPLAFEEALLPFVGILRDSIGGFDVSTAARRRWERTLLAALAEWAGASLLSEFHSFRPPPSGLGLLLARGSAEPPSREAYERFISDLADGGLARTIERFPVLGRALGQLTAQWVTSAAELLERLERDRPLLETTFNGGRPLGTVEDIWPTLSDPHDGGRRVALLQFESGATLVYKPRDVEMEAAYNALLGWVNELPAPLDLKVLTVLPRDGYGWVEYADHYPAPDAEAVDRYYRRAGQLLCLAYVLDATDFHHENLVAHGEHPVFVDCETLLHHRFGDDASGAAGSAERRAQLAVAHSVLRTGLLPSWQVDADARYAYDVSGLGAKAGMQGGQLNRCWVDVNTDRMSAGHERGALPASHNTPHVGRQIAAVDDYVASFLAGFRSLYELLAAHRERLLARDGPVAAFRGLKTRIVFRPTKVYGRILVAVRDDAGRFHNGAEAGLTFELLARAYLAEPERPPHWPVLAAERAALYRLEVPVFEAPVEETTLVLETGERIEDHLARPSIDSVSDRIRALDDRDLEAQVGLAEVALRSRTQPAGVRRGNGAAPAGAADPDALIQAAVVLARGLEEEAIRGDDGSATWIGPQYVGDSGRIQQRPLPSTLYEGVSGVALFLAGIASVTGDAGQRELALAAWRTVEAAIASDSAPSSLGYGAGVGLGSLLYAGVEIGRLLGVDLRVDMDRMFDRAAELPLAETEDFDVIFGVAGGILGLLAYASAPSLRLAEACGHRLVAARVEGPQGKRTWPCAAAENELLSGFSHGAAGIAYALLRLGDATGDEAFAEAALEAIEYERTLFDESVRNWPDLRPANNGGRPFQTAWCHGSTGIGLARLGGLPLLDVPLVREDIAAALDGTRAMLGHVAEYPDHMCCGNAGRIELLVVAAERLDRPELLEEGRTRAAEMLSAAGGPGNLVYSAFLPPGVYFPGFFTGAAGVGYELLRLARPDLLGSALLWETR